ncbi:MAG: glycosyltransferase family 4 protein [Oculatellaceae cyanobacterium Prado106]|jgi:glycosyltransferase involved in cell wall biosynthesis|nr:glycosyltransferase family 4 protein [Oculatellaceae cyanobacterium Prado106]
MHKRKLLFVSFPIDFGSKTYEQRLIGALQGHLDLKVYRFVPNRGEVFLSLREITLNKILDTFSLWKAVYTARKEGRKVLFQGISPALFAYPATFFCDSYIVLDWTRKLYEPIWDILPSPPWLTWLHRKVLQSQTYIFGLTDAVVAGIIQDYKIPKHQLKRAKVPFSIDLEVFTPSPNREDDEVRILFVGGDLYRKGGDILLRWFKENGHRYPNLRLTLVTKSQVEAHLHVIIQNDVYYNQPQHIALFKNHDIFVLPTKCDAYPSVLGEAACAGLALLTTQQALGAPEIITDGINGFICHSQEALLKQLHILIQDKALIESMKRESRQFMEQEFSSEQVRHQIINYMFED